MESIECKWETIFHFISNMSHKQEGEALDMDEQLDFKPYLKFIYGK